MSKPKRGKSGGSTGTAVGLPRWEQALISAPLDEDSWRAHVSFVVANKYDDLKHIEALIAAVASGQRKLFTIFSEEEILLLVKDLGNPKNKKAKEVPQHYEVCEACKQYLDSGEEIPVALQAKLIKFKLLDIKVKDQRRRETEKKKAEGIVTGKKAGKGKGDKGDGGKGKKGGKKSPEAVPAKEGSKLKKRGEEDLDKKFIDDEPDDGPQHYILIHGFRDARVIPNLLDVGVTVDSVIRISSQDYVKPIVPEENGEIENDEKTLAALAEAKNARVTMKKALKKFWFELLPLLRNQPDSSKLHDVARLEYEVQSLIVPTDPEDAEQKLTFGTALFEDVACMIYDLIDSKRHYQCYLENLKLTHLPEPEQNVASSDSPMPAAPISSFTSQADVDMRYYNDLMSIVPRESVSVPLILHCMIEQVVATEEDKQPPSTILPPPRTDGLNENLASHLTDVAFKLALSQEEYNSLLEVLDLPERPSDTPKHPLLINYGDDITSRTQHLQAKYGLDPQQVEKDMLKHVPFASLCNMPRPSSKVSRERSARLQELIHFCASGGLTPIEIDRAFKQFVLECMDLTGTDPNGFIVTTEGEGAHHTAIPWDDPYPYFKGMMTKEDRALYAEELRKELEREKEEAEEIPLHASDSCMNLPRVTSSSSKSSLPSSSSEELHEKGDKRQSRSKKKKSKSGERVRSKSSSSLEKKSKVVEPEPVDVPEAVATESNSSQPHSILRARSRSGSAKRPHSRTNSVHFEEKMDGQGEISGGIEFDEGEIQKSAEESMTEIIDTQKRNLDQWCFAEHFQPHVLIQVLQQAYYTLPYMDTYYHKRDHSLLLVLHAPHNPDLQSHVDWQAQLHSNVGFRNYQEHVSETVSTWLAEIEAKYQAQQLTVELDSIKADEEAVAKAVEKATKSKSPRRTSKSPKSSRPNSSERPQSANENPFLRNQSIKAWQMEKDRQLAEAEELEKQKADKKGKKNVQFQGDDKMSRNSKRPGSKGSVKSKGSQRDIISELTEVEKEEEEPAYWPFSGYDVGNSLINVSGITSTLFTSDGGQIRCTKTEFLQGQTCVETSILKDGHVFVAHLLDPVEISDEESDEELRQAEIEEAQTMPEDKPVTDDEIVSPKTTVVKPEECSDALLLKEAPKKPAMSRFGSVFANLSDGMCLAFSAFGASGEVDGGKPDEIEEVLVDMSSPSPLPQEGKPSPNKGKNKVKDKPPSPEPTQDDVVEEDIPDEEPKVHQPFQQLYITCPDGLSVRYFLESSIGVTPAVEEDRRLVVRMSYPFKTLGIQPCESIRKKYAMVEKSRTVTTEGSVVKHLIDGTIEVLYADGTVSVFTKTYSHLPVVSQVTTPKPLNELTIDIESKDREGDAPQPTHKEIEGGKASAKSMSTERSDGVERKAAWVTTLPSGERTLSKEREEPIQIKPVMVCLASDPETKQSMATRDDHVITISYPDGTTIVEHSDGTRITTYYRENQVPVNNEDTAETGEMPQYALQQVKFIKVECPAYATIEFNCDTSENLTVFGNGTTVNVFPDGYYMIHHAEGGRYEVDPEGTSIYYPRPDKYMEQIVPERELQYVLRHNADVICETVDPEGNVFTVKYNGDSNVSRMDPEEAQSELSSVDTPKTDKKLITYKQQAPRFFIIHRSGHGTELHRYQDLAEYLDKMEEDPSTAMLQDPLPDFPGANGITILRPIDGTPCDKWFKKYDMQSILPPGIRSRDLTTLPPKESKTDGPMFGTNLGKGLCVGGAVKQSSRFPILKCPDTIEIRQLIQYKPVADTLREKLRDGLKGYAEFVKERNETSDLLQVQDPRSEEEKAIADRLAELSIEPYPRVPDPAELKAIYEKATIPPVPSPPPPPAPKRTQADWERDRRELEQEKEGREALRKNIIPKYFDSELGKAFLLTQAKDMEEMIRELSEDGGANTREGGVNTQYMLRSDTGVSNISTPLDLPQIDSGRQIQSQGYGTVNSDLSINSPPVNSTSKMTDIMESPKGMVSGVTPSGLRPGNPTPAHATGQGSPSSLRPKNPTPSHSTQPIQDRPGNPTPTMSTLSEKNLPSDSRQVHREPSTKIYPSIKEQPDEESTAANDTILTRSLAVDVRGQLRTESVRLPASIQGGRPGAAPNVKYQTVEGPVRRNINNMMVRGVTNKAQTHLQQLNGLNLLPEQVHYGVLKEGYTYAYIVSLKNTGVDSCRYKIRQPPPSTGLRVLYKPGPIAAGMKVDLCIELYAIAVGVEGESGVGSITHTLEIVTETDLMVLPITATVLTADEFDNRSPDSPRGGKSPGARLVSTRPPANTGIIRPRKHNRRDITVPVR